MNMGKRSHGPTVTLLVTVVAGVQIAGCGAMDPRQTLEAAVLAALLNDKDKPFADVDENGTMTKATSLVLSDDDTLAVAGRIDTTSDVDVYDIGPLFAGERIVLDVVSDDRLDPIVAIFDSRENLIHLNDDRNFFASQRDSHLDFIVRRDSRRCFVAVAASPGTRSGGDYSLAMLIGSAEPVPPTRPQTVILNFDGALAVGFSGRPAVDVPKFDAGNISPTMAGQTEELINWIADIVREDYASLNVEVLTSRDRSDWGPDVSVIHFGAYDRALLGVAENIDEFNERPAQQGIIFTDTFQVFNILEPSLEEYAQALGNVTSHEIGHLLGLVHTADVRGIMDITASLRQLMREQAFIRSALEVGTFPIGFQDAAITLTESVGGDLETVRALGHIQLDTEWAKLPTPPVMNELADDPPRPMFSACFCRSCESRKAKTQRLGAETSYSW